MLLCEKDLTHIKRKPERGKSVAHICEIITTDERVIIQSLTFAKAVTLSDGPNAPQVSLTYFENMK